MANNSNVMVSKILATILKDSFVLSSHYSNTQNGVQYVPLKMKA